MNLNISKETDGWMYPVKPSYGKVTQLEPKRHTKSFQAVTTIEGMQLDNGL